jgi:hypothetical protein
MAFADHQSGCEILPTLYHWRILASNYQPDQVSWYHYLSEVPNDVWMFCRAYLVWDPARYLGPLSGRFIRDSDANKEQYFPSVPRVIGEAVTHAFDTTLTVVNLR